MITPQIQSTLKKNIFNAINSLIDNYINGKTYGTRPAKTILSKSDYDNFFAQKPRTILDFRKEMKNEKNLNSLLKDIHMEGLNMFNSELEYKNFVRELMNDVIKDRVAEYLDKKETVIAENRIMTFEKYINQL